VIVVLALVLVAGCNNGTQSVNNSNKVTICHATSSASNPYVRNTVAKDGAVSGHDGHPNDIIPPFDYLDNKGVNQHYPGKNMQDGAGTLAAGCKGPSPTTTAPPKGSTTTRPDTDGSAPATDGGSDGSSAPATDESDATEPPTDETDSTPPTPTGPSSATTTSTASGGELPPEVEVVPPGASSSSPGTGQAEAETPAGGASTTASASAGQGASTTSTADSALADTGSTSAPLVVVALVLLALGALGVVVTRRPTAT